MLGEKSPPRSLMACDHQAVEGSSSAPENTTGAKGAAFCPGHLCMWPGKHWQEVSIFCIKKKGNLILI